MLDKGEAEIRFYIKVSKCGPFVEREHGYLIPRRIPFNKIMGDIGLEIEFAGFLENWEDITSYVKDYFAVGVGWTTEQKMEISRITIPISS